MIISRRQMHILDEDSRERFHRELAHWLRRHAPRASQISDASLLRLINEQQERAACYGLFGKREIAKWCYVALITREDFDGSEPIAGMLRNPKYGKRAGERLDTLIRELANVVDQCRILKGAL